MTVTPRGAARRTGTSLAAPHVTGVVSLLVGLKPSLTPAAVTDLLTRAAAPFPGGRCDARDAARTCGRGVVDAAAAVKALGAAPAASR